MAASRTSMKCGLVFILTVFVSFAGGVLFTTYLRHVADGYVSKRICNANATGARELRLRGATLSVAHVAMIAECRSVEWVDLSYSNANDIVLSHIQTLPLLSWIDLSGTKVTNNGLRHFQKMPQLSHLRLEGTRITDDGLLFIEEMSNLFIVSLRDTKVSRDGVSRLQKKLPHVTIIYQ